MEMAQLSSPRHVALIYPHPSGATPIQQSLSFILTAVKHSVDSISPGNQDNQVVDNFNQSFFTYKALNDKITHYKNLIQCYILTMTTMLQIQLVTPALIAMRNHQSVKQALVVSMMLAVEFAFLLIMVCK